MMTNPQATLPARGAVAALCALFLFGFVACGDEAHGDAVQQSEQTADADLQGLAHDYLFKVVDDAESLALRERVRGLSPAQAEAFHVYVGELNGLDGKQRTLFDAAYRYARDTNRSFLDLRQGDMRRVLAGLANVPESHVPLDFPEDSSSVQQPEVYGEGPENLGTATGALCFPGYAECPSTSSWNKTLYGFSCASGACATGTLSDRMSNSACEVWDCDYRMFFPRSSGSNIDGKTAAADCVINYYNGLIAYWSGIYTIALSGISGPGSCGLSTNNIHQYFQVK